MEVFLLEKWNHGSVSPREPNQDGEPTAQGSLWRNGNIMSWI